MIKHFEIENFDFAKRKSRIITTRLIYNPINENQMLSFEKIERSYTFL